MQLRSQWLNLASVSGAVQLEVIASRHLAQAVAKVTGAPELSVLEMRLSPAGRSRVRGAEIPHRLNSATMLFAVGFPDSGN